MGLAISVVEKPTPKAGVVRFELNRSLTGMGHERYRAGQPVAGNRPTDELARRLFQRGGVQAVHVYSNEITVVLDEGATTGGMADLIRELFIHYVEGVTPSIP